MVIQGGYVAAGRQCKSRYTICSICTCVVLSLWAFGLYSCSLLLTLLANRFSCIYLTLTSKIRDRPTWTSQAALNCFFEIKLIFIFHGQLVRNEETWTDTTGKISENQESLLITKIDFRPVSISTLNPDNADIIHQDARCENGLKDNM